MSYRKFNNTLAILKEHNEKLSEYISLDAEDSSALEGVLWKTEKYLSV